MCDNSRECQAARRHGFSTRPHNPHELLADTPVHPSHTVIDKLGVTGTMRVALVGVTDEVLAGLIRDATPNVMTAVPREPVDLVLYQVDGVFALRRIAELASAIKRDGALWVLWPRGEDGIRQSHVQQAGRDVGLVDVKVASTSGRLSGLKFVYRLKDR